MPSSKIEIKPKIGSHTPTVFDRTYTHINYTHVASSKFAIWKACHAVLNASNNGCLTTEEVETSIRLQFPTNTFVRNTLNHTLSQSEDFARVFLQGRTPGRWYLTGKTGGVEKAAAKKARKLAEAASMSSASIKDTDIATSSDGLQIKELPYPIKMEGNSPAPTLPSLTSRTPPPIRVRTTRSPPPRSARGVDVSEAVARPRGGYHPYTHPSAVQALVDLGQPINPNPGSQFNTVPPLEIPSSATSTHYSDEQLAEMIDALQGPPLAPPKDSFVPDVAYLGDLEVNTVDPKSLVGSSERNVQQAPPQEELLNGFELWKPLEENQGQTVMKVMPCGAMITQEFLPVAYHTVVCLTCILATPLDEWWCYHSLVAPDGIDSALPMLPGPPSEQPQAAEPEVPTAGLRFDASFDLLGLETPFWM